MNPADFIGFIISLIAIFFLLFRRHKDERKRREHPHEYESELKSQEDELRNLLKKLDLEPEEEPPFKEEAPPLKPSKPVVIKRPPPTQKLAKKRKIGDSFTFKSDLDAYRQRSAIEERSLKTSLDERYKQEIFDSKFVKADLSQESESYDVIRAAESSRIKALIKALPKKQQMIIFKDIIGPPKGL